MAVLFGSSFSPALDLNFAGTKSLIDSISGRNLISYSRNSTATYVGSDGLIKTAAINEPRFDHDPVTGESLGLLIEESRTNGARYSTTFSNLFWDTSNIIQYNATTAPDGTLTAIEARASSYGGVVTPGQDYPIVSGTTYTVSIWLKAKPGVTYTQPVTVGVNDGGIGNSDFMSALNANTGWFRAVRTGTSSVTANRQLFFGRNNNGNVSTENFYAWGPQIEVGSTATSYIPTASTAVTRQADVSSITGSNFTRFFNNQQGTLYFKYRLFPNTASIGNRMLVAFADSIDTFEDVIGLWGSGTNRYVDTIGNGSEGRWGVSIPNSLTQYAIGYQVGTNTSNFAFNGALQGAVSTTPRTFNGLFMGGGPMQYIPRITYWSTRLQDKTLQVLTR